MTAKDDRRTPVMIIDLTETPEDRLNIYFKLMREVEKLGMDKKKCQFTWMEPFDSCVDFPYLNQHIREDYPLTTDAIDEWFRRCIEDMPHYPNWTKDVDDVIDYACGVNDWGQKWFNQFKESRKDDCE